jgi:5-methylthioribose kinase
MQEIMLSDQPIEQRTQILRDSCDQIEERSYTRKFDQSESNDLRAELAQVSIMIQTLVEELSEIKAEYKGKTKPLAERVSRILGDLKSGGEYVRGECFKFIDPDEGKVGWYSPEGYLLEERDIRSEERQRTAFQTLRKTGALSI